MRRLVYALLALLLLLLSAASLAAPQPAQEAVIFFTHDLHSNILPFAIMEGQTTGSAGGFARLKTMLDQQRGGMESVTVDAGDFSMGTLFQTIYTSHASELRLLGKLGYDAVTLGNHEFDYGISGLTDMLRNATQSGDKLPQLLFHAGNLPIEEVPQPTTLLEDLSDAFFKADTRQTIILEKNGITIGLFSVFGEEAAAFSANMDITPPGIVKNAKTAVEALRKQGAELIICLSHAGTNADTKKSEDERLAKAVPDIDIIVSGHSHTLLQAPIQIGNTYIVSSGQKGQYLGKIVLNASNGRWSVKEYALLPIDDSVAEDAAIKQEIENYTATIEQYYLSRFGNMKFGQTIGRATAPLRWDVYEQHGESMLGNLIADAYMHAAASEETPAACAVVPAGTIRSGIPDGALTFADAFNVSPLGIGPDGFSGYPLIDLYLTGRELLQLAEVDASISTLAPDAQLYFSGMNTTLNPNRLLFNRVTDAFLTGQDETPVTIHDKEQYRVVCGLYTAQMLGIVKQKSYGILSIVPKDEKGNTITDYNTRILRDENGAEIKEWYAIVNYIQSFKQDTDGIPAIPAYYSQPHDRKVVDAERGFGIHFSNLNGFTRLLFGLLFVLILAIAFILYRLATRRKRRRRQGRKRFR